MIYTNIYLTAVTLVMVPVMMKAGGAVARRSQKYFSAQQTSLGAVNGYVEEMITGQKVVKVFCHEETAKEEFGILNKDLRDNQIKAQFFGGIMGPVMGNLSQVNYSLTACIGGLLCVWKNFDVGGLTIFLNFSRQFSRPINEISMQIGNVFSALAGAERVFAIMDQEPEQEDDKDAAVPEPMKGHVILDHVTFGYRPGKVILKDISLYAKPGQKIAFVGSTGAGKTTITNLLNRFYDIQSGSITIDGVDIRHIKRDSLRQNIAMVLQDTHLFTGTVRENSICCFSRMCRSSLCSTLRKSMRRTTPWAAAMSPAISISALMAVWCIWNIPFTAMMKTRLKRRASPPTVYSVFRRRWRSLAARSGKSNVKLRKRT